MKVDSKFPGEFFESQAAMEKAEIENKEVIKIAINCLNFIWFSLEKVKIYDFIVRKFTFCP
jgi:hypothetical protein